MQLVDCFIELTAYVCYMIKDVSAQQPPYERVKGDIAELIGKSQQCCEVHQFDANDIELARFAVFAWIDETILNSDWQGKQHYQSEQLQRVYFQTGDAGEHFFDKLNELQAHQTGVREVYYLCLALGFTGRYCNPGDEFLLNQLKASNLKLLDTNAASTRELIDRKLFPEAYSDGSAVHAGGGRRFFSLATLAGASAPVLLFFVLFFLYRFVLSNVGEDLIKSIR